MAEWNFDQNDEDDEENEDEEGHGPQWGTRDGLIFLIDAGTPMFEKEPDDDSPFEICLKCARNTIQNKIISSDKDFFGIVFFGTDKSTNESEFKHIYIFHDLALPGAERVLQLEKLMEAPENDNFKSKFGHCEDFSLADALWTCSNMFSNCSQKLGFKRVLLFTNNDNPHADNEQLKRQAAAKAEDLHQNGIDLELMHMNRPEKTFDVKLFYKDILFADEDEQIEVPDPSERFEEMLTRVRSKNHKKRAMARIPFSFCDGLSISVGVYLLSRSCTKPAPVKLYRKTNEELKTVTKTFQKENGEILMPQDLKKSQIYASKKICFESEEVNQIKLFDKQGLYLVGFKQKSQIKPYFHVRPSQFIYPDETNVVGSTTVFTALLKQCLERNVVAIARYIPRKNTPPRFVALWPQEEELDQQKLQISPPGFHLLFLPFADDFRKIAMEENLPRANTAQIDKAKELVKKLQFAFHSESFENPALQQHYANVEAMALERDAPEEVTDFTQPDEDKIEKRAGKLIHEFKDLVFPAGYEPGNKRKTVGTGGTNTTKASKTDDVATIDIQKEAKAGKLAKLTVPVLREFAKKLKIKSAAGMKKVDLIDAISDHFGVQ